jgi:hypothetical protein
VIARILTIVEGKDEMFSCWMWHLSLTCLLQPRHIATAEQRFDGSRCRTDFDLGHGHSYPISHEVIAIRACNARAVPRTLAQGLMSCTSSTPFTLTFTMGI